MPRTQRDVPQVGRQRAYDPAMLRRAFGRLLSAVSILFLVAWLVCSIAIAVWVARASGIEIRRKGAVGLVMLIFLVPIGVCVALDELILRRIRYGPPAPGRRKRTG